VYQEGSGSKTICRGRRNHRINAGESRAFLLEIMYLDIISKMAMQILGSSPLKLTCFPSTEINSFSKIDLISQKCAKCGSLKKRKTPGRLQHALNT
jgi:hypothetical protein